MECVKFQPYTTKTPRQSSGSLSGGVDRMTLRSSSRSSDDDVTIEEQTVFRSSSSLKRNGNFSPGIGDLENFLQGFTNGRKTSLKQVTEKIDEEVVGSCEEAGTNGPFAVSLVHSSTGLGVGGDTYVNLDGGLNLVMWKLGTVDGTSTAYVFAKEVSAGSYEYVISNGGGQNLEFSTSTYSDPNTINVDTDDLSTDARIFVLFASNQAVENEGYIFPYTSWSSKSDSVKEVDSELLVSSHSTTNSHIFQVNSA